MREGSRADATKGKQASKLAGGQCRTDGHRACGRWAVGLGLASGGWVSGRRALCVGAWRRLDGRVLGELTGGHWAGGRLDRRIPDTQESD